MEKEKLTPLVLTLGLIIYGCTASAGQNDKIDSDRTFTVHLYSPIIGDEDRGSIYGSGYSGPYLAPGGDTEVPPDPTPSYPSINQVDDQTNALMLSSIASAAVMYAADELLIDSTMKSRQGVRQTGPFAAARINTVSFLYLLYQTMDLFAIRQRLFVSQLIRRTAGSIDMIVPGIIHLGLHDQIIIEVHCHHSFQVGVIFILTSNYFSILLRHCQYVVIIKITSKQKRRSGYEIFYPS